MISTRQFFSNVTNGVYSGIPESSNAWISVSSCSAALSNVAVLLNSMYASFKS